MRFYKTIRSLILLVLLFINHIAFSQEKSIHFGASFNAKITHQIFDDPDSYKSDDAFSYAIVGNIYYHFGPNFQLISGLSFNHYKINQLDDFPVLLCDFEPNSLTYIPYNSYFRENYKTNYLGIPLEGRYNIGEKANHFFVQFGFEALFKIALNETHTFVECMTSEREIDLPDNFKEVNDFLLLAKVGVGYEFPIGEKMTLFFDPNIEYSLTKFFKSGSGNSKFLNFGLNTGIKF